VKSGTGKTIKKVHRLFKDTDRTLSIAESCTGGLVSHYITTISGASTFFKAGVVSYSEESKKNILRISPDTISSYGVVSAETAREMAENVRFLAKSDFSVSTTGNLGPDVLEEKERGLIYVAAAKEGRTMCRELKLKGNREENNKEAAASALRLLIELVEEESNEITIPL